MRVNEIGQTISAVRLHRYVTEAGNPTQALRLYRWNAQVSSAYWTPLHFMEVAVRNTVHDALSARYQTEAWYEGQAPGTYAAWFYRLEREAVAKAVENLHVVTPGKVVASLNFGFWVSLLSGKRQYEDGVEGSDYHDLVWIKAGLHDRFGRKKRSVIHKRLDRLRRFRNRVAHHEHLMTENLDVISADIAATLGILCPATATWVRAMSDVAAVRARRPC